jgi:hypothetical protein
MAYLLAEDQIDTAIDVPMLKLMHCSLDVRLVHGTSFPPSLTLGSVFLSGAVVDAACLFGSGVN